MNRSSYYGIEDFAVVTIVALVMVNIKVPKEVCFWLFKACSIQSYNFGRLKLSFVYDLLQ